MVYGRIFVSTNIREVYRPTTPMQKMAKPPKNQTEVITETQPGNIFPEHHITKSPSDINEDKANIATPRKNTKYRGLSLNDVMLSSIAVKRVVKR